MIKSHLLHQLSYEVILQFFLKSDLGGDRTLDPMIKSHLLYQLSYEVITFTAIFLSIAGAKIGTILEKPKFSFLFSAN